MKTLPAKSLLLLLGVTLVISFLGKGASSFFSQFISNLGMVLLTKNDIGPETYKTEIDLSKSHLFLSIAENLNSQNQTILRGGAMINFQAGQHFAAQKEMEIAGYGADQFLAFARYANFRDENAAMPWYYIFERHAPNDNRLWLDVGLICQQQNEKDQICSRFLIKNHGNWFVDPTLEFDRQAWRFDRKAEVIYDIENCPENNFKTCLHIEIPITAVDTRSSWQQCMKVNPGEPYVYSAWIKVEAPTTSKWRPLYYQGALDGRPHGITPYSQKGTSEWQLWEHTFTMPAFDQDRVCFHPIDLQGEGSIWIYEPYLGQINPTTNLQLQGTNGEG
jgi:hypothetical protein